MEPGFQGGDDLHNQGGMLGNPPEYRVYYISYTFYSDLYGVSQKYKLVLCLHFFYFQQM